ncbi:Uncharacterized protein HZ326_27458 [Fusarium oxysporum f. sp. albedinis]|nr:Uncharacterized protein HZ326_27458 [Fusarium oxysporum f. sp. albedinis]
MNSKSQAASCSLDDRQIEKEHKGPTLVAPLDRKSSAHLILAVFDLVLKSLGILTGIIGLTGNTIPVIM